jgi:hypothetical protein
VNPDLAAQPTLFTAYPSQQLPTVIAALAS